MGFLRVLLVIPDFADIRQLPSVAVSQGISVLCGYDYFILVIITAIRNIGGDSKRRSCIDCFQGLRTLGQIQNVQLLIPDVDKAKLVSGHVVKWALEQGTCYIDIGLATRNGEIAPFVYN
jgi:hypothetical protein